MRGLAETIQAIVHDVLERTRRMTLNLLMPPGKMGVLYIGHPEGKQLICNRDGVFYGDTSTEVGTGTGGSGLWETDGTTTSLSTPQDISLGGMDLHTTNSGSLSVGNLIIGYDGADDYQISTTVDDIRIQADNGAIELVGNTLTWNSTYEIVTSPATDDINMNDNEITNLFRVSFGNLNSGIECNGQAQIDFNDGTDDMLINKHTDFQGLNGIHGLTSLGLETTGIELNILPSASMTTGYNLTMPPAQATASGQTLINNGSGTLSWGAVGSNLVDESAPALGADLDCNGYDLDEVSEVSGVADSNMVFTCDTAGAFVFRKMSL